MNNKLQATLERLQKMTAQNQNTGSGVKYWKPQKGKNNILILPSPESMTGDPFLEWGEHRGLMEPNWKSVPCLSHNKGEECVICSVIEDLKSQNWKGNFKIWKPIELKIRYFSPVVDLDDLETGVQWWGYGKSVLGQLENWLLNLEEGETPFYDLEEIQKVIVSYDPDADPSLQYKLDAKALKSLPEGLDLEEMVANLKPLSEVFSTKSSDELATLLEEYMQKIQETLDETTEEGSEKEKEEEETPAEKKLSGLKKKK